MDLTADQTQLRRKKVTRKYRLEEKILKEMIKWKTEKKREKKRDSSPTRGKRQPGAEGI